MYRPKKRTKYAVRKDGVLQTRLKRYPDSKVSTDVMPFYRSLLNPLGTYSAGRVPDLAVYPSATAVLDLEVTQTGNNNAIAGGILFLTSNGVRYYVEAGTSADAGFVTTSESVAVNDVWQGNITNGNTLLNGVASLQGLCDAYRVVGAGINVEFIGNDSNNQGQIILVQNTASAISHSSNEYLTSLTAMSNHKQNYTGAAKHGGYVAWKPADTDDLNYGTAAPATAPEMNRVWYNQSTELRDTRNFGSLQWHATGLSTGAAPQFRVTMRVHLEILQSAEVFSTRSDEGVCVNPGAVGVGFAVAASKNVPGQAKGASGFSKMSETIAGLGKPAALGMAGALIAHGVNTYLDPTLAKMV